MREVTKEKILEIVNDNLQNSTLSCEEFEYDLEAAGLDSIGFIKTVVALEDAFDCEVPDDKLLLTEMNTINKIYDVLVSINDNNVLMEE